MPARLIGYGQTISQPYMVALIAEAASVRPGDRVLDVGSGSGYAAAVLAELGADVHTIERIPALADKARAPARRGGLRAACTCTSATDRSASPEEAPYDAITVAAAAPRASRRRSTTSSSRAGGS